MTTSESIHKLVEEWLRIDQDETTRQEVEDLVVQNNFEELGKRLSTRISFGTAGLRARMEAGFSRMNCVTVIQASQGLAEYVLKHVTDARTRGVVIGHDARHNSSKFAKLTAAAFVNKKVKVWWYERPVHTPLVPFGVTELGAAAGVMITASHNPPRDNGYKVYWENGSQIIPPHDAGIASAIENNLEPLCWDKHLVNNSLLVEGSLGLMQEKYVNAVKSACDPHGKLSAELDGDLRFAYTAMHGVGLEIMQKTLTSLELNDHLCLVQEQAHPDPDFPSLPFPNPEEKGALDVAIASANRNNASLILATDPDADRLAVAEKTDGNWYQFSGNQLGILLAAHIWSIYDGDHKKLAMIASTVSSQMLAHFADKENFRFAETLTGFKWMGNKAHDLNAQGFDARFAFEESIGYMIPAVVKDKDGVAAATMFLAAVARWHKEEKLTPFNKLQQLYKKYGYFEEANTYFISPSPMVTATVFDSIRSLGGPHPSHLGQRRVTRWRDLTIGWDSATSDHKPLLPVDSSSQMITCELHGGIRLTVRASGTEPKIKVYIESHSNHRDAAKKAAYQTLSDLVVEWLKPGQNSLQQA